MWKTKSISSMFSLLPGILSLNSSMALYILRKTKFQRCQLVSIFHIVLNSNCGLNLKIVNNCDPPVTLGEKN